MHRRRAADRPQVVAFLVVSWATFDLGAAVLAGQLVQDRLRSPFYSGNPMRATSPSSRRTRYPAERRTLIMSASRLSGTAK